jgi:adenylate cyclase
VTTWACSACGGTNPAGTRFCGHCGAPYANGEPSAPADEQQVADALRSFVTGAVADRLVEGGGRLPEERRLITALFADVSGFTSLAERLDPEQLLEVIDPVIAGLSDVVDRYEGYVEKFAGDALLALFGAPISHEDDAQRALIVALEMHDALARMCAELPHNAELTLHVGVNSGHGIARILGSEARMDYAVLGDSVILAQRLESAAPAGKTYVSDSTYRLASEHFEFAPVGELTLKGKQEPIRAWELVAARTTAAARRTSRLVGRTRELAAAERIFERGQIVAVTGEPGVGKSRLTEELRARAASSDIRWLQTRCLSYGAGLAYWPYGELVRSASAPSNPFFARLLGTVEAGPELEPEAFRRGLHDAFVAWLGALAAEQTTVLCLEDVHWADPSSLELTKELAQLSSQVGLSLYLTARPEAEPDLTEIAPDHERITLRRLGLEDVAALIDDLLGGPAPPKLGDFVRARTAGNPFFVGEVLRSLQDEAVLAVEDGTWQLLQGWDTRTLPDTVEGVLAARIDALPRAATAVLQTASVIGRRVGVTLLRKVHGDEIEAALDELVRRGFLDRDDGQVVFHHALIQDAAYERLLRRRRRQLHLLVAEAAEELHGAGDDTIDLLARHLYLGESPRASEYLVRAGRRAQSLFANEEAILHFKRAHELAPDDLDVALALADLHELTGEYEEAHALYDATRHRDPSNVRSWCGMASTLRRRGEYLEALGVVDEAFSSKDLRGQDLGPLWLQAGWSLSVAGFYDAGIDVFTAGLETAEDPEAPIVGELLLQLAQSEILEGKNASAQSHARRAAEIFERTEDVRGLTASYRVIGDAERELGDLQAAAAALRQGLELARRTGSVEEIGGCLLNLGRVELERGALPEAIECDRGAIAEFERIGHGSGRAAGYANLAEKLILVGDLDEAIEYCDRAEELARSMGNSLVLADTMRTRALALIRSGAFADAAAAAEASAALFAEIEVFAEAASALEVAADASARAGEEERAQSLRDRARSLV